MAKKTATKTEQPVVEATPHPYCADGCGNRVGSAKSTFLQGHDQRLISDLSTRVTTGEMGAFQRALLSLVEDPKAVGADEFCYVETGDIMDRINTINAAVSRVFSVALADKFTSAAMAKWDKSVRRSNTEAARAQHRAEKAAAKANAESPATKAVFRNLQTAVGNGNPDTVGSTLANQGQESFEYQSRLWLKDQTNLKTTTIEAADWTRVYEYFASGLVTAEDAVEEAAPVAKSTVGQPVPNLRGTEVRVKIGRWTYDAIVVGMNQAGKVSAVEYKDKKGNEKTTDKFELVK